MEETKYKLDDVVEFIAGGPRMAIIKVDGSEPKYQCKWFTRKGETAEEWFRTTQLILDE